MARQAQAATLASPGSPADRAHSAPAATRHMCVGAYIDRGFREQIIREVYNGRDHRTAPSYGFDLIPVLIHSWRAWRLEFYQNLAVLTVLLISLVRLPLETIIAVCLLFIWYAIRGIVRCGVGIVAYFRYRKSISEYEQLRARVKVSSFQLLGSCIGLIIATVATFVTARRHNPLEGWPSRAGLSSPLLILLLIGCITVVVSAIRQVKLNQLSGSHEFRVQRGGRRLSTIRAQQSHPFTVYSTFKPFIGAGANVTTWSFAQRLIPATGILTETSREYDSPPFTTKQLVMSLRKSIEELRQDANPETRLRGLTVEDQVFVEGTHSNPYRTILNNDPTPTIVSSDIDKVMDEPRDVARHYLTCEVVSWYGEVVTTVFVHVSLQGRSLYLEFATYALTPTRQAFHVVDQVGETGAGAVARSVGRGLAGLPDILLGTRELLMVPRDLWASFRARNDGTLTAKRGINIGAEFSAREASVAWDEESYFQFRDILKHSKIIERKIIATVGDFLRGHGVDTSEFWQRATVVLNTGVINAGPGTVNITGSAIGDFATVNTEGGAPAPK